MTVKLTYGEKCNKKSVWSRRGFQTVCHSLSSGPFKRHVAVYGLISVSAGEGRLGECQGCKMEDVGQVRWLRVLSRGLREVTGGRWEGD